MQQLMCNWSMLSLDSPTVSSVLELKYFSSERGKSWKISVCKVLESSGRIIRGSCHLDSLFFSSSPIMPPLGNQLFSSCVNSQALYPLGF